MRGVLAIDFGERKSGFAYADGLRIAVRPLGSVRAAGDALLERVAALVQERDTGLLLVGLPYNMDGTEGPRAAATRAFATRLRERFPDRDVRLYDERLTTKEAESRLREAGFRGREVAAHKDSWAAWVLLRDWVDSGEP